MTPTPSIVDAFTETAKGYDERNRRLTPIADSMHFLIRLILKDLPRKARVLCMGVGTGAEILSLAADFPGWTFVGVDPSRGMLEVCRQRLSEAGILDRCELIEGYLDDAPAGETFDAALSILVGHFVAREDRIPFYRGLHQRLVPDGILINTELSFDLDSPQFPTMLERWASVQSTTPATAESLANLSRQLRETLTVLSPSQTELLLHDSGIPVPVRFFQAFLICGWYGTKAGSRTSSEA